MHIVCVAQIKKLSEEKASLESEVEGFKRRNKREMDALKAELKDERKKYNDLLMAHSSMSSLLDHYQRQADFHQETLRNFMAMSSVLQQCLPLLANSSFPSVYNAANVSYVNENVTCSQDSTSSESRTSLSQEDEMSCTRVTEMDETLSSVTQKEIGGEVLAQVVKNCETFEKKRVRETEEEEEVDVSHLRKTRKLNYEESSNLTENSDIIMDIKRMFSSGNTFYIAFDMEGAEKFSLSFDGFNERGEDNMFYKGFWFTHAAEERTARYLIVSPSIVNGGDCLFAVVMIMVSHDAEYEFLQRGQA